MVSGSDRPSYRLISRGGEKQFHTSILEWVSSAKKERGVHVKEYEGFHYLLIAAGMKPNPGYRLVIEQVREDTVYIRELPPSEGMMTPQVVTYPYLLLRGKGSPPEVLDSITGKQITPSGPDP
ncbi:PrcB C-terminal [Marininema mesophilum]|uniref:PrcB C-terminal n=1 Tax=Marininema mesophilum TaxID=1048340 RepID=A0A1H2U9C2_9BACL|nr:protease complex subunit PrcB family protein [Marininema mesophilum]SDW52670.1 PrcB C-terminal [Marininema mesophilum]